MLDEMGISAEIFILTMFQYEDTFGLEEILCEDDRRYIFHILQRIRRVGKDEIKMRMTTLNKSEHIATERDANIGIKFLQA